MWLKVYPAKKLQDIAITIPSSKPETQRAVFIGSFTNGISKVHNDLRCVETSTMKEVCKSLGIKIEECQEYLEVHGKRDILQDVEDMQVINCLGSGLIARIFTVLGATSPKHIIVTGDATLRKRVMHPLFDNLERNGVQLEYIGDKHKLPVMNKSKYFPGGKNIIPGDVSSQFITAFLITAPFAKDVVEIQVDGEVYSKPYIRQTIQAMENAGVQVEYSDALNYFKVKPQEYHPCETYITGDYTSASYMLAKAALFPGITRLHNMSENSLQGEKAIIDILKALGLTIFFNEDKKELIVKNDLQGLKGNFEFNAMDFPNIVPTLAAMGAFVEGKFRVVGASITRLHKSSRVDAMISELRKAGVDIQPIYKNDVIDGFEILGKNNYDGGVNFTSWGDHRIFMSLFVFSLRTKNPNCIDGFSDVDCSFPRFLHEFKDIGAEYSVVDSLPNN